MPLPFHVDFETRSTLDLRKVGAYKYARHSSTEILCMAWSVNDTAVHLWAPGQPLPTIAGTAWRFFAHNAQFERLIWQYILAPQYGAPSLSPTDWYCTAAMCAAYGLPRSLDQAAEALKLPYQKDKAGHKLMMKYCKPRRYDEDGQPVWWDDPEELTKLYNYCRQDVKVERALAERVPQLSPGERAIYLMDQKMADTGIGIDLSLVQRANTIAHICMAKADKVVKTATLGEVTKVTQVQRMTKWLGVEDLTKATVQELLDGNSLYPTQRTVLTARAEAGKTSMAKLKTFEATAINERLHGMLVYHGAHTGRWSARLAQPHNLPRGTVVLPEQYIRVINELDSIEAYDHLNLFENPADVISSLLRSMFIAGPDKEFLVGDYSAIEATITAWLAGQDDLLERFASDEDVYAEEGKRVGATRQHGKAIILGCGFGMGHRKFVEAALKMFGLVITEEQAKSFVQYYRTTYPKIPNFWKLVDTACRQATLYPGNGYKVSTQDYEITIECKNKTLQIMLPSGRKLYYHKPLLTEDMIGTELTVMKQNSLTGKWERSKLYGGLITENIVQATARDIMAHGMKMVKASGHTLVLTVHDEVICEEPDATDLKLDRYLDHLSNQPQWASNLPIKVNGFRSKRYKKD